MSNMPVMESIRRWVKIKTLDDNHYHFIKIFAREDGTQLTCLTFILYFRSENKNGGFDRWNGRILKVQIPYIETSWI